MIQKLLSEISTIYMAYGATDFRKLIASLCAEVIYQKYYMGTPLYRQEKMWDDLGLVLPRNMMANWCIKISQ